MRIPADESFRDLERYFRLKLKEKPPEEHCAAFAPEMEVEMHRFWRGDGWRPAPEVT